MELSLCIVTSDVPRMRAFYATLLRAEPSGDDDYTEFIFDGWRLALCPVSSVDFAAPGAHVPGTNRCVRIELPVDDVDAEHERLRDIVAEWVTPPTDWPWGARATWLRDPDGNLISLYRFP